MTAAEPIPSGLPRRLLIANRGEIALRIIRTCRRLGVETVAVFSEADQDALHVREADQAICIGPAPATESYLKIDALVQAALASGASALHPGYGFASEDPRLAEASEAAGLVFVGPSAAAMRQLGDKAQARRAAIACGIPVIAGFDGSASDDQLAAEAERIGFPIMVKAAAGGGGRGIRLVHSAEDLSEALASSRREAKSAFGDDRVILERALIGARHIEVQVVGDSHGKVIHLGERDCSLQRRHQKVVEEAPSPSLSPSLRGRICEAATKLAESAGYRNAGTVEFLVTPGGQFYFLEMNTRLQVEHGVTELVTGLDLVELQLIAAAGLPLPLNQEDVTTTGHAIECRIYAEDPARDFAPSSGEISLACFPSGTGIRVDSAVHAGAVVTTNYDSMIAKLMVHGADRPEAISRLSYALAATEITGFKTNLPLLDEIARMPEFVNGAANINSLGELISRETRVMPWQGLVAAAGVEVLGLQHAENELPRSSAWRGLGDRHWRFEHHGVVWPVDGARVIGTTATWEIRCGDQSLTVSYRASSHGDLVVTGPEDVQSVWSVQEQGRSTILRSPAHAIVVSRPRRSFEASLPADRGGRLGELRAYLPGVVTKVLVHANDRVTKGDPLIVMEAMKMEHFIAAPDDAEVLSVSCEVGDSVAEGASLIVLGPAGTSVED